MSEIESAKSDHVGAHEAPPGVPDLIADDLSTDDLRTDDLVADEQSISAELLSAFLSLIPDAAVVVDETGLVVSVNEHAEALFGYRPGSLAGLAIETLVPERLRQRHRKHRARYAAAMVRRPMGAGLELTGRRLDGHEFPVDISLAPILSSGQELVIATVRDVTEKRAATATQAELAAIVRSSLDAIISTNLEGHITSWNPAAEVLLGFSADEILGAHISALVPASGSIVLEELLDFAYAGSHHVVRDTRWCHHDGSEVDVTVSISPLRDDGGTLLGFSSVVHDNSERKRAEDELQRRLAEEKRLERQNAVTSEIRLALLSEAPLEESLSLICERVTELVGARVAIICISDADDLRVVAAGGDGSGLVGMTLPVSSSFAQQVMARNRHVHIEPRRLTSSGELPSWVPDGPALGVPVIVGGVPSATLTFVRDEGAPAFSPADLATAEALAPQAALAFELERARHDREQMTLMGDRERIARDLHDHVIQQLFSTGLLLQSTLSVIDRPPASEKISAAVDSLDETIRAIRRTIFDLARPASAAHQLRAQIGDLVREAANGLGFEPALDFEGPIDSAVPDDVVPHVLAVVREALSNVARHARARRARVQVAVGGGILAVAVTDDGVGIAPTGRSSGLANLEGRARVLGGDLVISAPAGGGTRIDWRVPLGTRNEDP